MWKYVSCKCNSRLRPSVIHVHVMTNPVLKAYLSEFCDYCSTIVSLVQFRGQDPGKCSLFWSVYVPVGISYLLVKSKGWQEDIKHFPACSFEALPCFPTLFFD